MKTGFVSFAEVKRAVALEAVLARYGLLAGLKPRGSELSGPCPFCKMAQGGRFKANLLKNVWYCFGCKAGGNTLDFVARSESVSLRQAAIMLNEWFGLGVSTSVAAPPKEAARALPSAARRDEAMPTRNDPMAFSLKTIDRGHESVRALGLSDEMVGEFGLGYCARGLLKGRIAVPIRNGNGELVAYAGLAPKSDAPERYRFPPKFQPGLEIFNLHRLASVSPEAGPTYLAPEMLGVLELAAQGFSNSIGLFDGSLSEAQEASLSAAIPQDSRILLVGVGFESRVFERLSRSFSLRHVASTAVLAVGAIGGKEA